jgi:hypothetical protein
MARDKTARLAIAAWNALAPSSCRASFLTDFARPHLELTSTFLLSTIPTNTTSIMAETPSRTRFVSSISPSHSTTVVLAVLRADPVNNQKPEEASVAKAIKMERQEEPPTPQDLPAITADLSRAFQELQRLQHSVDQLHARQDLQESQAISAGPLRTRQEFGPTPKPLADSKQISSKELHRFFGNLSQLVSVPKGTKRRPESTLEPTTSKRAREHKDHKEPQRVTSQASLHAQPDVSQQSADDLGDVRPENKSAGPHPQLAEASRHSGTAVQVPASPPFSGASMPRTSGPSRASRRISFLASRKDDECFFLLSRVKCELEERLSSRHDLWARYNSEAQWMLSPINYILSCMSSNLPRCELELSAEEWRIWDSLELVVEKKRARMLEAEAQ